MSERPWWSRWWYEALRRVVQLAAVLGYGVRYGGQRNIPREGGVLVVANHQSHLDPPLVGMACPRRMNYLARQTLFGFAPFAWLIHSLDAIPIDREGLGLAGIKESLRRLKRGEMVLIFPEGARTFDGEIAPFLPGFAALAVRSRSAILPVAIAGAFEAWPRVRRFPQLGQVRVRYAEPLWPDELTGLSEHEIVALVEARVRAAYDQLRGVGSGRPPKRTAVATPPQAPPEASRDLSRRETP